MLFFGCGQRFRREAQLDEWLDVTCKQIVVEAVDSRPVVNGLAILDADCLQHVVKDGVEPDVAEAELVDGDLELRLAIVAYEGAGVIGADGEIEETIDRAVGLANVSLDDAGRGFLSTGSDCFKNDRNEQ